MHTSRISFPRLRIVSVSFTFAVAAFVIPHAEAQNYQILYAFAGGSDGVAPYGGLLSDGVGNLYGTTVFGGTAFDGVAFKLGPTHVENVLTTFMGAGYGANPGTSLIRDASGNLLGTTAQGSSLIQGVIFSLTPGGAETVLYDSDFGSDAVFESALVQDSAGNLYGTSIQGGASGQGVAYKLSKTGAFTILHSFTGGSDGGVPYSTLILDVAGNLYGTASAGGNLSVCGGLGCGVVFKIDPTGKQTILHSFSGLDGARPIGGLLRDWMGTLYGTTYSGGLHNAGTIFKLDTRGNQSVLHNFAGGGDGANPGASLIADAHGNFYGTTVFGGASELCPAGCGTALKYGFDGQVTIEHRFVSGRDGAYPESALILDASGKLYGTTAAGGASDAGIVFQVDPSRPCVAFTSDDEDSTAVIPLPEMVYIKPTRDSYVHLHSGNGPLVHVRAGVN